MATIKIALAVRNSMAQQILDALNAGTGPATLEFYTGAQPAGGPADAATGTKLGTLTCSDPAGAVDAGALTFGAITQDDAADDSGTAGWARLKDSDGLAVADFDVSNTAGTGAIKLNTTTIVAGGPIAMTSFVITMGGA